MGWHADPDADQYKEKVKQKILTEGTGHADAGAQACRWLGGHVDMQMRMSRKKKEKRTFDVGGWLVDMHVLHVDADE